MIALTTSKFTCLKNNSNDYTKKGKPQKKLIFLVVKTKQGEATMIALTTSKFTCLKYNSNDYTKKPIV